MVKNETLIKIHQLMLSNVYLPIYDSAFTCYTCNTEVFSWGFSNKVPIVSLNDYIVQVLTRKHIVINYPSEES